MIFVHTAKIVAFGFLGFAVAAYIPLMIAMVASGAVGNWVGEEALNRVSEQRFRLILQLFLTALGLQLLWNAVKGWGLA